MESITVDETIKECSRVLGHQVENKPQLDTSKIVLTAEVNPKILKFCNVIIRATSTTSSTSTVYTTPTTGEFYLTGVSLSYSATVLNDQIRLYIQAQTLPANVMVPIIDLNLLTTVAQANTYSREFTVPIKIAPGTIIGLVKSFTAGAGVYTALITGYTSEYVSGV